MKKVAVFASCDSFEGFYGGTFGLDRETYLATYRNDFVWEYAQGLRDRGHEVYIYFLSYGPPEVRRISERLYVRFLHLSWCLRGIDPLLFRLRNVKYGSLIRDRVAYLGYGRGLLKALRDDAIGTIYHQEIWTPRFDIVVEKVTVPVVGADHGAKYFDWMESSKRRSFTLAARLVCQSITGVERARTFGADPILLYNGVDLNFFSLPSSMRARPKTVLAVGRLVEAQKRFSDLLRAMVSLPEFTLTLVGSGPDEAKLKELAKQLGITERVRFLGFVSDRKELRSLYQDCGVFISTSSWEAVALVLLEAMSCGAPIVATRIPSFEDVLTDGKDGILIPVGVPTAISEAIQSAHERQKTLGFHARNTVSSGYSSAILYGKLSDLIETI